MRFFLLIFIVIVRWTADQASELGVVIFVVYTAALMVDLCGAATLANDRRILARLRIGTVRDVGVVLEVVSEDFLAALFAIVCHDLFTSEAAEPTPTAAH